MGRQGGSVGRGAFEFLTERCKYCIIQVARSFERNFEGHREPSPVFLILRQALFVNGFLID